MAARSGAAPSDAPSDWRALEPVLFSGRGFFGRRAHAEASAFADFHEKYRGALAASAARAPAPSGATAEAGPLELPTRYDRVYRLNFRLLAPGGTAHDPLNLAGAPGGRAAIERRLGGEGGVSEARHAVQLYEDFVQRKRFAALHTLWRERRRLPIASYEERIVGSLRDNGVLLLVGDTGCGKSTQLPQMLLRAGYARIACTQPRRLAAVSVARRVGAEMADAHRRTVGHQVRFESSRAPETRLLFVTEGVMLRYLETDPDLSTFDAIILDEVHERHVSTDVLLGLMRSLVLRRPSLRLVLMSATLDAAALSAYFAGAPLVRVPGRAYAVETTYMSANSGAESAGGPAEPADGAGNARARRLMLPSRAKELLGPRLTLRVLQRIDEKYSPRERGDALIFVSGVEEIERLMEPLREYAATTGRWVVMPLHASLPVEQQERVFDVPPDGVRKVRGVICKVWPPAQSGSFPIWQAIVATNVAETSVTIDGVRFVVDSGAVKEMHYDGEARMASLTPFWVSKASAEQRKGRAGRTGPGMCFRLYSADEFTRLDEFATPELLRSPLEPTVLQLLGLGVSPMINFEWLSPPAASAIAASLDSLRDLRAVGPPPGEVTPSDVLRPTEGLTCPGRRRR